ncbi:glycosyltransferase family 4 protein [uncultured Algimonas sp.]|uniref:glycosyltransferase family 4 protein n=1 Tax=uncultured Algimonas sp. TaxID=1547920 RepID=UPI002608AE20|nr:glycosyltransferase family 4 protein [uncultured Algimonas sp.]
MSDVRPYNVLQVLPALEAGGVERTTIEVADALGRAGHGAFVASGGGRLVSRLAKTGATHFTANVGSKRLLSFPWRVAAIRKLIVLNGIDIVHARSRAPAWAAWRAALAEGVPFVTTYHGIYNEGFAGKRRYNSVMARGDLVIANSTFTARHIMDTHGTPEARIRIIPRGVDMAMFDPDAVPPRRIEAVWKKWSVNESDRVVLLPARLTRWKGQTVAIRALAQLPDDTVLVCAGDPQGRDAYVAELRALAEELGVAGRLRLPGHEADMPAAMLAADRVLTPSTDPEAFGRTAAEAQAMGRWVVASGHGGAVDVVEDGVTGTLAAPGDPQALARALTSAPDDHDAAYARARIGARFSKAALQQATLDVYAEVLPERPAGRESAETA